MPAAARKVALTDRSLKALKPAPFGKRLMVWDGIQPNLAVRVTDKGRRSFVVVARLPGAPQPTWTVLGQYPTVSLADARKAAREALGALAEGKRPSEVLEQKRRDAAARHKETFAGVAELFIKLHLPKLRTARSGEALIRRELIPALGERPIGEIRRRDVIALCEAIVARGASSPDGRRPKSGGQYAARHAFAALSKLFNWAVSRDIEGLEASPIAGLKLADLLGASKARDRVLSDIEVRAVWRAAGEMGSPKAVSRSYPFGDLMRVLLLTGQRKAEIAGASWSEISDLDGPAPTLTVPAERMKSKAAHVVPLTPAVVAIFRAMPRFAGADHVFTTTAGRSPVSGFSRAEGRARALAGIPHWQIHDLRRTCRTGLSTTGALPFFAELVIGHAQSGVHGVYDLHKYDAEKREALERWEARLLSIVAPVPEPEPAANVVELKQRARA